MLPARLLLCLPLTLAAASAPVQLKPGLWRIDNVPQSASLDGRPLHDLPFVQPEPEMVCMDTAAARQPTRWFTRDSDPSCTFTRHDVAGGRVDIAGTCPSADGKAPGTVRLTGAWTPVGYRLRFATVANGENGRMGFGGTLAGMRIGECPAR